MAINYARLFEREAVYAGWLNEVNAYRGPVVDARIETVAAQFIPGTDPNLDLVTGLYSAQADAKAALDGAVSYIKALAEATLIAEVKNDRPLTSPTKSASLAELRRQMIADSETLNECPGTAAVATVSATGDHSVAVCVKEDTGRTSDFLVPDVYRLTLTADRSQGGTAYAETFSLTGLPIDAAITDAAYPTGTGVSTSVTALNPATAGGLVTEPGFDAAWTGNTPPTPWALVGGNGTAGTSVFKSTDDARSAGFSLRLYSAESVVLKVRQLITPVALGIYTAHFRIKKVADPGTDWAVSLLLVDGTGAAVTGPGSYSNVISSAASTSIASSWANPVTGTFVLPAVLPSTGVYLEVRLHESGSTSTAAQANSDVYVDHVCVNPVTPLYAGGPGLNVYSGLTEGVVGDLRTITVALTTGEVGDYLIRGLDRLLDLAADDSRIPTGSSPTRTDYLLVGPTDLADGATTYQLAPPQTISTTLTGSSVDMGPADGREQFATQSIGGASAGDTLDGALEESTTGSGSWTTLSGGAFTQVTGSGDNTVETIRFRRTKRYVRYVGTVAGNGSESFDVSVTAG